MSSSYDEGRREGARQAEGRIGDLEALLVESKRSHLYCDDSHYSCPKHPEGCSNEFEVDGCTCGADAWNAKLDALLNPTP